MSWQPLLQNGERILWRGRPAPRCYTFRYWRLGWAGVLILCFGLAGWSFLPAGMSLLLLVAGLLLAVGLPVLCRLFWVRVDYVLTNQRIYWRGGPLRDRCASRELADLVDFSVYRHGPQLATVSLRFGYERRLLRLFCLEHPETLTLLLKPQFGHGKERG